MNKQNQQAGQSLLDKLRKKNCPKITDEDFKAITTDWAKISRHTTQLIDKKISRTATASELVELERLKSLTEERGELFAPLETFKPIPYKTKTP